jgi:hypothetical protein
LIRHAHLGSKETEAFHSDLPDEDAWFDPFNLLQKERINPFFSCRFLGAAGHPTDFGHVSWNEVGGGQLMLVLLAVIAYTEFVI